jgi:hypothetical protein
MCVNYGDKALLDILEYGWLVDYSVSVPSVPTLKDHSSNPEEHAHNSGFIIKDLSLGALLGPFSSPPFTPWFQSIPHMT